jgi:subtilisin family serine protease
MLRRHALRHTLRRTLYCLALMMLLAGHASGPLPSAASQAMSSPRLGPGVEIEPELQRAVGRDQHTGYVIYFDARPDLGPAYAMDWEARGRFVVNALRDTAESSQARVRAYLAAQGAHFTPFWIDNVIVVERSTSAAVQGLGAFSEIAMLRTHRVPILYEPESTTGAAETGLTAVANSLARVGADQAWALGYTGEDLIVANIDTGVRFSHNALRNAYRGYVSDGVYDHNYSWWDPYGIYPSAPVDTHGHGTHTMGTMVGDDGDGYQIGLAPGARWIACRGCNDNLCDGKQLLACAQWIAAPWDLTGSNANPDLRPHVVNNSWGDCGRSYDPWYQGVVDTWQALGIYPVFSNGNAGGCGYSYPPPCNTVGNPARYANVTGVGSTGQSNGAYANHSNRGPTDAPDTVNPNGYPTLKPQVVAPGVSILSSTADSNNSYSSWNGTSMSAPHVAGLVALVWQAGPCLTGDYAATQTLIQQTARHVTTNLPPVSCAGEGPGSWPNQSTGWGEIDALAAVEAAIEVCNAGHTLSGIVRDAVTGWPLYTGIQVVTPAPGTPANTAWSEPVTGAYSVTLAPDTSYTLTFTAWVEGYRPQVVTLSPLTGPAILNVALEPDLLACTAPSYVTAGTPVFSDSFDTPPTALPGGWAQLTTEYTGTTEGRWATSATTVHPSGYPPHSGPGLIYFNSYSAWVGSASRLYRTVGLNLSETSGARLSFWLFGDPAYELPRDLVQPQLSSDGGATWIDVGDAIPRYHPTLGWRAHHINLDAHTGPGMSDIRIGFLGVSGFGNDIHIDDITVSTTTCVPTGGGLVAGHVRDANTLAPLHGASVGNDSGGMTTAGLSFDPAVGDGFYTLFVPAGASTLTASFPLYGTGTVSVTVEEGETVASDLFLTAGIPSVDPAQLEATIPYAGSTFLDLALSNDGGEPFTYTLQAREPVGAAVVTWLATDPAMGSLNARAEQLIRVHFDSSSLAQHGTYLADLEIVNSSPYGTLRVPVTLTVQALPSPAQLRGTVTGLGTCDATPLPLAGATVTVMSSQGESWTLTTGPAGEYQLSLDVDHSPLTVTATATGHLASHPALVTLSAGATTTLALELRLNQPCIHVHPETLHATLALGGATTLPLTVTNTGAAAFDYATSITERGVVHARPLLARLSTDSILWLSTQPSGGTVPPNGSGTLGVTFDARPIATPGSYFATLHLVGGNPPTTAASVPVTLTVTQGVTPALTLSVHVSGAGHVTIDPQRSSYAAGDVVRLTAIADAGHGFEGWRVRDGAGERTTAKNPLLHEMRSSTTVTATFVTEGAIAGRLYLPLIFKWRQALGEP